eukprot:TRINITY_DN70979_c0_g1_i1.p2 TRINITY_DN70979_c0_g1~~TRINITY_DN70979_c0_g1_i1.p2  ORF type:complete len:138 (-),score=20.75 TRINITY_DN70979_c0_g1_i1:579-992(-)
MAADVGPALYLHYDAVDNVVQMMDGWKEFSLYDPFQAASVLYGSNKEHGNGSPVDPEDSNVSSEFPFFKYAYARKCNISRGQWLYVPLYWWHYVRSGSDRTVSLAHMYRSKRDKKKFFEKIMCGYSIRPAAMECGSR